MLKKAINLCLIFAAGVFAGWLIVKSGTPQPVVVSTSSKGRCMINHGNATHIQDCQILRKDMAYIEHRW